MDASSEHDNPDPTGDALRAREALTGLIVAQIDAHGYFLTHVDPQPHQDLVDLRWAAQVAGRVLGRKTHTHVSKVGARQPGKVTVVIAPDEVRVHTDDRGHSFVRTLLEDLLERPELPMRTDPATA